MILGSSSVLEGRITILRKSDKHIKFKMNSVIYVSFERDIINKLEYHLDKFIQILDIRPKRRKYIDRNGNVVWSTDLIVNRIKITDNENFIKWEDYNKQQDLKPSNIEVSDDIEVFDDLERKINEILEKNE